jgi:hypothetical protein
VTSTIRAIRGVLRLAAALTVLLSPAPAAAQPLPAGPVSAFDGRLVVGAEASVTIGQTDDLAFFNYTDYEHNALRMFRVALSASWQPLDRIAFLAEVRSEDLDEVRPYAAYVRVRPWRSRPFDIQAGRIPPVFGSFGRRAYAADNPLVGYPLAHQYLTALRPDAIPATVADLLVMRARGWRLQYPVGARHEAPGIPLTSAFRWDTGVQARWRGHGVDATAALTNGTLSDPQLGDNNPGKSASGRIAVLPATGLVIGGSAARGEWLDRRVMSQLRADTPAHAQTALGADVEYSRDHWLVRSEVVWSRWRMPFAALSSSADLDALAVWIEGRYRLTPRVVLAARLDHLGFSKIASATGAVTTWDAPVTRVEGTAGYYLQRNLVFRLAVQHNDRDGGRVLRKTFVSGQVAYWF